MPAKRPGHRTVAQTVWTLLQVERGDVAVVAVCSSNSKAEDQAARLIAKACGVKAIRLPDWTSTATGGRVLVYGRDSHSFQFRIEPWLLDGEAA